MKATLCLRRSGPELELHVEYGEVLDARRPFPAATFRGWSSRYRAALTPLDHQRQLLELGLEMGRWLDEEGWLQRLIERRDGPLELEVRAHGLDPDEAERALLDAPWELLATPALGHLAGDALLDFRPHRRLGQAQSPPNPSRFCLFAVFMAAQAPGTDSLEHEAEEAALLAATQRVGMDLLVEDSGALEWLAHRLALGDEDEVGGVADVLHLSCHGTSTPKPTLLLETDLGGADPVDAAHLVSGLGGRKPRLLFLSACHSAASAEAVDSLSQTLVRAGLPAALGWAGAVRDVEATAFARLLYKGLAAGEGLEASVAAARRGLLNADRGSGSRDWHLARLVLGPRGGGRLVRAGRLRSRLRRRQAEKVYLDAKGQQVPVAGPFEFVGRRRTLQSALRALRGDEHAGVVLHGVGGLGKSSLAARLHSRLTHHRVALVVKRYRAEDIFLALAEAVRDADLSHRLRADARLLRDDPLQLRARLVALLEDELSGVDSKRNLSPVLLVVDDFEQVLVERGDAKRHHPRPDIEGEDLRQTYAELVRAFRSCRDIPGGSKLLFTTRVRFALPDELHEALFEQGLAEMSEREALRQDRARASLRGRDPIGQEKLAQSRDAGFKNPRLMARLFDLAAEDKQGWETTVEEMRRFAEAAELPSDGELQRELEGLALERLLALAPRAAHELLRVANLFHIPVPLNVVLGTARAAGIISQSEQGERLSDLGLWEPHEDLADTRAVAVAPSALIRGRLEPWSESDTRVLSSEALPRLWSAWRERSRSFAMHAELLRLALIMGDAEVAAHSAPAVLGRLWQQDLYDEAQRLVTELLPLLDAAPTVAGTPTLWLHLGRLTDQLGADERAARCFQRGLSLLADAPDADTCVALMRGEAESLRRLGEVDQALIRLGQARELTEQEGLVSARAVTLGDIARIRVVTTAPPPAATLPSPCDRAACSPPPHACAAPIC